MAQLLKLGTPLENEKAAIDRMAKTLPDNWIVTTRARGVGNGRGKEIDSVVLTPRGIVAVELKHYEGQVRPRFEGPWLGAGKRKYKNPMEQADLEAIVLKGFLRKKNVPPKEIGFVRSLIVLSHPNSTVDLSDPSLDEGMRNGITMLESVEAAITKLNYNRDVVTTQWMAVCALLLKYRGWSAHQARTCNPIARLATMGVHLGPKAKAVTAKPRAAQVATQPTARPVSRLRRVFNFLFGSDDQDRANAA